jgi:muramoyltetrapeptide carboxypeptidase
MASAPPRLRLGDAIGVVAPAGPVNPDQLRAGLDRLGGVFRLVLAPSLTAPRAAGLPSYLHASDDVRAAELAAMIADPDIRGILLARGGYGITRILSRLDPTPLRRDPKPIVGFSDATALLAWAHAAGVRGIHGPVAVQLARLPDDDVARLIAALTDPAPRGVEPWRLVAAAGRGGVHRGPLIPANLTLATVLLGTAWRLPLDGAIALFEEVGERPYELDRYLTQLALAGELARPAAVILGELTRCADPSPPLGVPDPPDAARATCLERLAASGRPAAWGAPIGHGAVNAAVPFGAACVLDLEAGTLEIVEGAVG